MDMHDKMEWVCLLYTSQFVCQDWWKPHKKKSRELGPWPRSEPTLRKHFMKCYTAGSNEPSCIMSCEFHYTGFQDATGVTCRPTCHSTVSFQLLTSKFLTCNCLSCILQELDGSTSEMVASAYCGVLNYFWSKIYDLPTFTVSTVQCCAEA